MFLFQALQEFIDLLSADTIRTEVINEENGINRTQPATGESDAKNFATPTESAKALLPFWPRIYNKVANDNDRRVREFAHRAHLQGMVGDDICVR